MKGRKGVMKRKRCKNWCRRGIIFLLLLGAKIAPTIYRSSRLPHQGESLSGVPWQFKADPKPCPCGTGHGLNHTITRSRNRQWSKIAPSAAVLDHRVMFLASAHKETSLRSSSTTERACYHAIYNPTKKKCLQHLLTRKRFLYFCSRLL